MQGMQGHITHEDIDITLRKGKMREEFFLIPVKFLMRPHHAGAQWGLADLRFQFAIGKTLDEGNQKFSLFHLHKLEADHQYVQSRRSQDYCFMQSDVILPFLHTLWEQIKITRTSSQWPMSSNAPTSMKEQGGFRMISVWNCLSVETWSGCCSGLPVLLWESEGNLGSGL